MHVVPVQLGLLQIKLITRLYNEMIFLLACMMKGPDIKQKHDKVFSNELIMKFKTLYQMNFDWVSPALPKSLFVPTIHH